MAWEIVTKNSLKNDFLLMMNNLDENVLTRAYDTPFDTVPFDKIKHEHYVPAFKAAIEQGLNDVEKIVSNAASPTFENTIEWLSYSGEVFERVSNIFYNLNSAETDAGMQEIARELSPMVSDYYNDILFNEALFKRFKAVYEQKDKLGLSREQQTLLEKLYKRFSRNGANLDKEAQKRLRGISKELSELSLRFQDSVLAETNAYMLHITEEEELSGLPQTAIEAAAKLAQDRNMEGWAFSLQAPSFMPFLQYADKRSLRQDMYMAFSTRASKENKFDNRDVLKRIANLRLERAKLLGYPTHAYFVLEERMAESPEKVNALLHQMLTAARPTAENEVKEVQAMASEMGADFELMPWDWSYYAEKLRQKRFDFDQELLRPYFGLENVKQGIFSLSGKLWGLRYVKNVDIPVYHPDVETYEVYDHDESFLAILYLDFFPREGKSPGAWMTSFRGQYKRNGQDIRPHISVVCNFSKPTDDSPSLLTHNEVSTFLHEFGHALHGILSGVTYPELSGTNVYRDFVELPSMLMENWSVEHDFLNLFAAHYKTGEKIPEVLIEKIMESRNFNAGYAIMRQIGFGLNDMAWHSIMEAVDVNPLEFELNAMEPAKLLPRVDNVMVSPAFAHIFSGGYAAGYYSYKWSEVLDADAFQLFKDNGIFDKETARSLRENILSKGGSEHPMTLYKRFRGKEPTVDALLRRDGLID